MPKDYSKREQISADRQKYPYGARTKFKLMSDLDLKEPRKLPIGVDEVVRLVPSRHNDTRGRRNIWFLEVVGFESAARAEKVGQRMVFSLLWWAVSRFASLRMIYDRSLPCQVFDRNNDRREPHGYASGFAVYPSDEAERMAERMEHAFHNDTKLTDEILTALELYNAAYHETTDRAKFVMLVSSMEPLISQRDLTQDNEYGSALLDLVNDLKTKAEVATDIPDRLQQSLISQIGGLKHESIGQGLRNLCTDHLVDQEDSYQFLRECYDIRSKILHRGGAVYNLSERTNRLRGLLRRLYSSILELPLNS